MLLGECERSDSGPPRARSGRAAGIAEASVRLGVTASLSQRNARTHADPRSNGCRSARAISTQAPPTGPLSSTVSQVHAGCKQKSSSVGAVDQTAGTGARQRRGPGDQTACSECREPAPGKRPDYCSPTGGGVELVTGVATASERTRSSRPAIAPRPHRSSSGTPTTSTSDMRPTTCESVSPLGAHLLANGSGCVTTTRTVARTRMRRACRRRGEAVARWPRPGFMCCAAATARSTRAGRSISSQA